VAVAGIIEDEDLGHGAPGWFGEATRGDRAFFAGRKMALVLWGRKGNG
jgi:hypothetical protein